MTAISACRPVADHGVLVVFDDRIGDATLAAVHALDAALHARPPDGLVETVPALTTLLVGFDPLLTDHAAVAAAVAALGATAESATVATGTVHVVDVCYDPEEAADLAAVVERTGLDPDEVVAAHTAGRYTVGMYGFAPGYAYLYGTPPSIQLPRNPTPGAVVPAGSVIITGEQCLISPVAMSTGWFAIGRTAAQMLTGDETRPFLFDVGDTVTFRRVSAAEFHRQLAAVEAGRR